LSRIFKPGEIRSVQPLSLYSFNLPEQTEESQLVEEPQPEPEPENSLEEQLHTMEREAYTRGFEAGERAGIELGQQKIRPLLRQLSSILEELKQFKERYYADKERELVELVIAIAKKIIHTELSLNQNIVAQVVRAAVKAINKAESIVIKVNPDDLDYVLQLKPELLSSLREENGVSIEADPHIGKGGCLIQSNHGEVDARIEEGMRVIESIMRDMVKK